MESWQCINQVVEFIENHLSQPLNIELLSKKANLSPFYFQKLFKQLVGKSPIEYVRLRRLALAAEELRINQQDTLLNICLKYGFESHEVFTRSFKDAYGITPSNYRKAPVLLSHFLKPELTLNHELLPEGTQIITNSILLEVNQVSFQEEKYFAGHLGETALKAPGVDDLASLWDKIHQEKASLKGYLPEGNEIGVCLEMGQHNQQKYFAGAQVTEQTANPDYQHYILRSSNYVICKFEAEDFYTLTTSVIDKVYQYMYLWIMEHKLNVKPEAIELYFNSTKETAYMELWIPMNG